MIKLAVWERLHSFFHKHKEEKEKAPAAPPLLRSVRKSLNEFAQRVAALNDSYASEKQLAAALAADAKGFKTLRNINAAKFEQDILIKITEASSACNAVLTSGQDEEFKKQLAALDLLVRQRKSMKD